MALCSDREGLYQVDAHVGELAGHVEAMREQLGRLDAMDGHLSELARGLESHQEGAGVSPLHEEAVAALIDSAAERAASRVAASLAAEAGSRGRIQALEGLLQDYIAERRRGDEATAGVFNTIEDALLRIVDRVEAMEGVKSPAEASEREAAGRHGTDPERDLLAEAYAEGARVLGQQGFEPSLHAADYLAAEPHEPRATAAEPAAPARIDEPVPQERQSRQELRASALRAKLKAQGAPQQAATQDPVAEAEVVDEAKAGALGHGRIRTWTSARTGSQRFSLLLGGAMALLFGTGFMAVDSLLGSAPPAGAQQSRVPEAQPATRTGAGEAAPRAGDGTVLPPPMPQPAPRRPAPEAATDDPGQSQPAPTRRLNRLQSGTASAAPAGVTPVMMAPQDRPDASAPAADGATDELPASIGTPKLRQAAAAGDAFAQFEIATRFAEGKGVAQDHEQAFAWYERAATRGLASAQFRLAAYFERGVGVAADKERAKVWYTPRRRAGLCPRHAQPGRPDRRQRRAPGRLRRRRALVRASRRARARRQPIQSGHPHENGRGVPKDLQEAYKWFALAARSGDPVAARRLEQVKARMEPAERRRRRAEARGLATDRQPSQSPARSAPARAARQRLRQRGCEAGTGQADGGRSAHRRQSCRFGVPAGLQFAGTWCPYRARGSSRPLGGTRARAGSRRTRLICLIASEGGIGSGHRCGSAADVTRRDPNLDLMSSCRHSTCRAAARGIRGLVGRTAW